MTSSWDDALDALEERVRRQEAVVDGRSDDVPPGGLPIVDGPLPADKVARAMALLDRITRLEREGREELARMRATRESRGRRHGYGPAAEAGPTTTRL